MRRTAEAMRQTEGSGVARQAVLAVRAGRQVRLPSIVQSGAAAAVRGKLGELRPVEGGQGLDRLLGLVALQQKAGLAELGKGAAQPVKGIRGDLRRGLSQAGPQSGIQVREQVVRLAGTAGFGFQTSDPLAQEAAELIREKAMLELSYAARFLPACPQMHGTGNFLATGKWKQGGLIKIWSLADPAAPSAVLQINAPAMIFR